MVKILRTERFEARISKPLKVQLEELAAHQNVSMASILEQAVNLLHSQVRPNTTGR